MTVCKRIIYLSEEINQLKTQKQLLRQTRLICTRSPFNPPSSNYISNMLGETDRAIEERRTMILKMLTPLFRGHKFEMDNSRIELPELGSLDIYRGYIELEERIGKNNIDHWVLFLKPFNIGIFDIKEGDLLSNNVGVLNSVLETIKPIKPSESAKSFYDVLISNK